MPEPSSASQAISQGGITLLPEAQDDASARLSWAYPLDEFYRRAGLPLPLIETVTGADMPEPYRSLLVHQNDMTPTLSAYYARLIHLRVLSRHQRDGHYSREVLLVAEGRDAPIEFGAIRINLPLFAPAARRNILDERVPLGHLLRVHSVSHSSRPQAFFKLKADKLMQDALQLSGAHVLYGRRNTLLDTVQRPLAEVVEILPPAASREDEQGAQ